MPEKKKNITLKTIAEAAQCSTAVVSTVLNASRGNTKVSDRMREKILTVARTLDYTPNYASRSLKANCSRTLGIYVQPKPWRQLANSYEMSIFRGIEQAARDCGYDILVLNISAENLPDICKERLKERRIDGVLLLHCDPGEPWIDALLDISSNVMAFDINQDHPRLNRIDFDNRGAIFLAVETLFHRGHRRIAYAGSGLEHPTNDAVLREQYFLEAVHELGLPDHLIFNASNCPVRLSETETYCQTEGREAIRYFHRLSERPDAIVTYNSLVGISLLQEAKELNISVPEELSILTVDNVQFPEFFRPMLTVVDHPLTEMGYEGVRELIRLIQGETKKSPVVRVFGPVLKEGFSVANKIITKKRS